MKNHRVLFAFLPWLDLCEPAHVGAIELRTVRRDSLANEGWDKLITDHVRTLMDQHVSIKGDSRGHLTVVCHNGAPIWLEPDANVKQAILRACRLVAVSAIADNEERASLIGYANYAIFRPYFQEGVDIAQPWFAFTFRRKYFDHDDMGYDSNKVRFSCPSWAHGLSDIQVNKKLLDSLQAVAMPESDPKKLGVLNAIHCFLLSYVDDDWTLDHEEAAMALRAIEVLLKATTPENPRQRKKGDFAKKEILADRLDWLLDLPAERNRFGAVVKRRLLPHLQKRRDQPVLWNWFVDLYELRNAVFHEGDAKPTVWAPREHSVIAAQVFLVALWKVLTKEFGATEPDKLMRRLQIAEKVLCESDWWRVDESGPHSNAWTRAASEVAHDALVEVMRKMYDEDNAPNT